MSPGDTLIVSFGKNCVLILFSSFVRISLISYWLQLLTLIMHSASKFNYAFKAAKAHYVDKLSNSLIRPSDVLKTCCSWVFCCQSGISTICVPLLTFYTTAEKTRSAKFKCSRSTMSLVLEAIGKYPYSGPCFSTLPTMTSIGLVFSLQLSHLLTNIAWTGHGVV